MKTWLFALLESIIAGLGLAAYFWVENIPLATIAAVLAATLGVAQPVMAAMQARKLQRYQEGVYQESIDAVDGQIAELLAQTIDPPLPHRPTVEGILRAHFPESAGALSAQYDRLIKAIGAKSFAAEELAAALADKIHHHPLAVYLCGLAAFSQENFDEAHRHFTAATQQRPAWVAPWVGWATTAYRLQRWGELSDRHPHVGGVELTPYDVGDEQTFIDLEETERDALVEQFQTALQSLGNYYTAAEFCKSKTHIDQSRAALRKAA